MKLAVSLIFVLAARAQHARQCSRSIVRSAMEMGTERSGDQTWWTAAACAQAIDELRRVIRNGVPAPGMPACDLPPAELEAVTLLVRSWNAPAVDSNPPGDRSAGEHFFFGKGGCLRCHMVMGKGAAVGPDLSSIGRELTLHELEESVRQPAARIVFANTGIARLSSEIQSDVFMFALAHGRTVIPVLSTRFMRPMPRSQRTESGLRVRPMNPGGPRPMQAFESTGAPRVTGERHLVTRSGAHALRWRRDGKELFYLALDGRVHAVPAKLSPKPEFGPATPLFTISTEARAAIHSVPGFDVSPNGQRFLIPAVTSQDGPSLVVMQNWEAALPQNRSKTIP